MLKHQDDLRDLDLSVVFGHSEHFRGTPGDDRLVGTDGRDKFNIQQGGNDIVKGGEGNDIVVVGASLTAGDRIDGGAGRDTILLEGDYSKGLTLENHTISQVERLKLLGDFDYSITLPSHMTNDTHSFTVNGTGAGSVYLNGSALDILLAVIGSSGNDTLIGGKADTGFAPGGGHDVMTGGSGANYYQFLSTADSPASGGDSITNFNSNVDVIELFNIDADPHTKGHQDFHFGATPNHVGDVTLTYDAAHDVTMVNVFTDKDANPDMVIQLLGNHTDLTEANFVL